MSIFKTKGFDTLIGKDSLFKGDLILHGACVVDGYFDGGFIKSDPNSQTKTSDSLLVNGEVKADTIVCHNLTIVGSVTADDVIVDGTLAIKSGSKLTATNICYRTLVVEPGAIIMGPMQHLDHISEGEQV